MVCEFLTSITWLLGNPKVEAILITAREPKEQVIQLEMVKLRSVSLHIAPSFELRFDLLFDDPRFSFAYPVDQN